MKFPANWFEMSFKEKFPTFQDYQKRMAQGRLDMEEIYYKEGNYAGMTQAINLMDEFQVKLYKVEKQRDKMLENRKYLEKCVRGEVQDPLYAVLYIYLSEKEK